MQPTGRAVGLDMGFQFFYTDNFGHTEENPRFYRKSEKRLNRLGRRLSRKYCNLNKGKSGKLMVKNPKQRQSNNYHKARVAKAKQHLRVSRQREEHAKRLARCVCASNDCIVYEDLKVKNLVRNHKLSKSITDAGWTQFRKWVEYFGNKFGKITIAVPPNYTSQDCPACDKRVKKSLSTRTHVCECGCIMPRDQASGILILKKGLNTVGHTGIYAWGDTPSWAVGASLSSNGESLNQESPPSSDVRS